MNQHPEQNLILASLSGADMALLDPHFRDVALPHGQVLCEPGERIDNVYFPVSGMISIVTLMESGGGVETGVIGREGVACSSVTGSETAFDQTMVQAAGEARRLPSKIFLKAYNQSETLRAIVNRHNAFMWATAQQCVACNSLHRLEARLARWLLQTRDRLHTDDLPLTQEFLSLMLAVQRSSVATAAAPLKEEKLIRVRRGHVHILDADGLTEKACECYSILKDRRIETPPDHLRVLQQR